MQAPSQQKHYEIRVILPSGKTKIISVKASSLEVAEQRALKRTNGGEIDRYE